MDNKTKILRDIVVFVKGRNTALTYSLGLEVRNA